MSQTPRVPLHRRTYDMDGFRLGLITDGLLTLREIDSWFRPFAGPRARQHDVVLFVRNQSAEVQDFNPPEDAVLAHQGEIGSHYVSDTVWTSIFPGLARVRVDAVQRRVDASVDTNALASNMMPLQTVLYPAFELMSKMGLYMYHASAASRSGRGILIAGKPGAGKSTLTLHLVSCGWSFVSDDRSFVKHASGGGFDVMSFSRPLRIDPVNAVGFETSSLARSPFDGKVSIDLRRLLPEQCERMARLDVIVFPELTSVERTTCEPVDPPAALKSLLPLAVECFLPDLARSQFEFNADLASNIRTVLIRLGRDRADWEPKVLQAFDMSRI